MNDIVEMCRSYQHTAKLIGIGEHTTIVPNKLKKKNQNHISSKYFGVLGLQTQK